MNASALVMREEPGKRASLALAVGVHLVLAVLLIYGVRWPTASPEAVEVELVARAATPAAAPSREVPPEPRPMPPEPRPVPKVEPKPEPRTPTPAKPDIAVKDKEKEKPPAEPPKNSLLDKLNREFDQLTHRKASDAARAADQELENLKASQAAAARNKALAGYVDKIKAKIRGNLIRPPELQGNPEAIFDVTQLPSGEVLSVKLRKGSGSSALDAAIERAILKSSPLPKPEQGELFSRTLELKFRPLEE